MEQNAWAADYDSSHFKSPEKFMPERYLGSLEGSGTLHYAFGAGSRMCIGAHLANRELYTAFVRLIVGFHILPPKDEKDMPILDALECNAVSTSLTTECKKFKCGFKARDVDSLKGWIAASEERTRDL